MKSSMFSILIALVVLLCIGNCAAQDFAVNAEVGLLFDYDSGQVLFSQQGDSSWIPASLVKVMMMYTAFDRIASESLPLDSMMTVSENAWRTSGSQMFLEVGEEVSLEDLIYGIAVVSGNDACVALAEALAGTEELFVRWMNEKAEQMGLDLYFVDVHGLSEENRITAHDFALLVQNYIQDHPNALMYHSEPSFGYQPRSSSSPIVQANRNGLLRVYEGTDGLKTGFLSKAGYNLVATASRNDRRLIAVILGADSEASREQEAINVLDYGFRSFENIDADQLLTENQLRVYKGREDYVEITTAGESITIVRGLRANLETQIEYQTLSAPIHAGEQAGEMMIYQEDKLLKSVPLVVADTVERGSWFTVLIDTIMMFFSQLFNR